MKHFYLGVFNSAYTRDLMTEDKVGSGLKEVTDNWKL